MRFQDWWTKFEQDTLRSVDDPTTPHLFELGALEQMCRAAWMTGMLQGELDEFYDPPQYPPID